MSLLFLEIRKDEIMKKIIVPIVALILCCCLWACTDTRQSNQSEDFSGLVSIVGRNCLYYDQNTKIVYIMFRERGGYDGYGYMSPYYAPNGLPYIYDINSQSLIEINNMDVS